MQNYCFSIKANLNCWPRLDYVIKRSSDILQSQPGVMKPASLNKTTVLVNSNEDRTFLLGTYLI